jgi:hypothetical protein
MRDSRQQPGCMTPLLGEFPSTQDLGLLQARVGVLARLLLAGCTDSVTDLALMSCTEVTVRDEAVGQVHEHHAAGGIGPYAGSAAAAGVPEGLQAGHAPIGVC